MHKSMDVVAKNKPSGGFSLMELLVVMSIMGSLLALGAVSYFAAIAGMAQRSAVDHLMSTLTVARQRACMDATRVGVIWFNESVDGSRTNVVPTYVVCKAVGRISKISGSEIYDEFTPLNEMFGLENSTDQRIDVNKLKGMRLFNMTQGTMSLVIPRAVSYMGSMTLPSPYSKVKGGTGQLNNFVFYGLRQHSNSRTWQWREGDVYGVASTEPRTLPKGIVFASLADGQETAQINNGNCIWFSPDGSVEGRTIRLTDTKQKKSCSFTVNNDGSISPEGRVSWN